MDGVVERQQARRRPVLFAMAIGLFVTGSAVSARAEDGVLGFFQQVFGGPGRSTAPLPQPDSVSPSGPVRPLTVHKHEHRRPSSERIARSQERYTPEQLKLVTIYTDKTLMRGDAVMTERGLRIFNGSGSGPHTDVDFVALSSSGKVPKNIRKELNAIDLASRTDRGY